MKNAASISICIYKKEKIIPCKNYSFTKRKLFPVKDLLKTLLFKLNLTLQKICKHAICNFTIKNIFIIA